MITRVPTWHEMMHPGMHKIHGMDGSVWHVFFGNCPDVGHPHDHPWTFRSEIIFGGYVEEVYDPATGARQVFHRRPGDSFMVPATKVHKIIDYPEGNALTRIWPEEGEQKWGFWRWENGFPERRDFDGDWQKVNFDA